MSLLFEHELPSIVKVTCQGSLSVVMYELIFHYVTSVSRFHLFSFQSMLLHWPIYDNISIVVTAIAFIDNIFNFNFDVNFISHKEYKLFCSDNSNYNVSNSKWVVLFLNVYMLHNQNISHIKSFFISIIFIVLDP